jgi:hypothetical protein
MDVVQYRSAASTQLFPCIKSQYEIILLLSVWDNHYKILLATPVAAHDLLGQMLQ